MNIKPLVVLCLLVLLLVPCFFQEPEESPEYIRVIPEPIEAADELAAPVATEAPAAEEPEELDPVEVELIGRTIWGEADGVKSEAERAAVAWCILNRVDASGQTIEEVALYIINFLFFIFYLLKSILLFNIRIFIMIYFRKKLIFFSSPDISIMFINN